MIWQCIGFFPKRRTARPTWMSPYSEYPDAGFPAPMPVEEICSVSRCIARGSDCRMEVVAFNQFGGYESIDTAWRAVPEEQRDSFDMFAYRLALVLFEDGQPEELEVYDLDEITVPDSFRCLGYDAVELCYGTSLGCSPLSCNGQTYAAAVNRYCLVGTYEEGAELARTFSISKPEPGPYCVVEVWRQEPTNASAHGSASDR